MEKEIRYTIIPDEITLVLSIEDINDINSDKIIALLSDQLYNDITCICFVTNPESSTYISNLANFIKSTYNKKVAWFNNKQTFPFKSDAFDYIQLNTELYMNISESKNSRFICINNKLDTLDSINPVEEFYFEKFEELKKQNIKK